MTLPTEKFDEICLYIREYKGLWMDCEESLSSRYPDIDPLTLGSIFLTQKQNLMKKTHYTISTRKSNSGKASRAQEILTQYAAIAEKDPTNGEHILRLAVSLRFSPVSLARKLLVTQYPASSKQEITEMLRNCDLIPDPTLALNVSVCVFNDNLESGLSDLSRRCIGEEYEVKLKTLCRDAGLIFYDEGDLRREGYDKTPDLKLAVPFMYCGRVVSWIESKALFGDLETHKDVLNRQLQSYVNRFGSGVVIYWFGYQDTVEEYEGNGPCVMVWSRFPDITEMERIKFS